MLLNNTTNYMEQTTILKSSLDIIINTNSKTKPTTTLKIEMRGKRVTLFRNQDKVMGINKNSDDVK